MATAVPAIEPAPGTIGYELEQIRLVANGGKKLSRAQFGEQIGITASQLMGAETGKKIKEEVWEKIKTAYPHLEQFLVNHGENSSPPNPAPTSNDAPASDTLESSSGGDDDGYVPIQYSSFIDDPYPLTEDLIEQVVVVDVQPAEQKTSEEIDVPSQEPEVAYTSEIGPEVVFFGDPDQPAVIAAAEPTLTFANGTSTTINVPTESGRVVGSDNRVQASREAQRSDTGIYRLFSNSELQTFKRCPRKWYLTWHRGLLLKKGAVLGPRATGTRVHYALEHYYVPDGTEPKDPRETLDKIIAEDRQVLVEQYGSAENVPENIKKDFAKSRDLEQAIIEGYMEWLQETGADQGLRVIAPEQYVEKDLGVALPGGRMAKLIGKIDVRVQRETDNAILFLDHKTVQTLDQKTLHMNEQMMHYHLLEWLTRSEDDPKVDGALYNMLRKVKRTGNSKPPYFGREHVSFSPIELQNYRTQVTAVIKEIVRAVERLNSQLDHQAVVYPNKKPDCAWSCDFFPVCPMFDDGSRADAMIEEHYVEGDPLKYYGDRIPEEV